MSAYNRAELSPEAYLVRILAALCRQNGGELRVKGELVDQIGEATALLKEWDSAKQELVLRAGVGSFVEVYKVNPEKQTPKEIPARPVDPLAQVFKDAEPEPPRRTGSTIDNPNLAKLEHDQRVRKAAAFLRQELEDRKKRQPNLDFNQ